MSRFERWYLGLVATQCILLLGALVAALHVGNRQNAISTALLDLHFTPTVALTYEPGRLLLHNRGESSITFSGTVFNNGTKAVEQQGRVIAPGMYYYLVFSELEPKIRSALGVHGEARFSLETYLTTENGHKYVAKFLLWCVTENGQLTVHPQLLAVAREEWQ